MRPLRLSSIPALWIASALAGACATARDDAPPRRAVELHGDEPVLGPEDAPVEIVVWGDLASAPTARVLTQVIARARDPLADVKLVWKALPANAEHLALARTAVAAAEQGRFWEYVGAAASTAEPDPDAVAEVVGLDAEGVAEALDGGHVDELVKRDLADGRILGLAQTPTVWINGRELVGAPSEAQLDAILRDEVARADWMLALGASRDALDGAPARAALDSLRVGVTPTTWPTAPVLSAAVLAAHPSELDTAGAPSLGPADAAVELTVVGSYGCTFSQAAFDLARAVRDAFPGQVRLTWLHRPDARRPDLQLATRAAEEARAQGAFWRMHFALLGYRGGFTAPELEQLAAASGLDAAAFARALEVVPAVVAEAAPAASPATPSFIVNGLQLDGLVTAETLWSLVALQRARVTDRALVSTL